MNTKHTDYDVLIIGGGPAGSTAGYLLHSLGYNVLIVDKSRFPRIKLCGGATTQKVIKLLERVFNQTEADLIDQGVINYTVKEFEVRYKQKQLVSYHPVTPLHLVDRKAYDHFLLSKTMESGVHTHLGEKVISCDMENHTITTSNGQTISGRYILAADGVNSIVRRNFPKTQVNRDKWLKNLGTTFEIFVNRDDLGSHHLKDLQHLIIYLDVVKWGYTWIFPKKDHLVIGIGGLISKNKGVMRDAFFKFLKDNDIPHETITLRGHNIPLGNYITRPVFNNVMLTGDAGGFVEPLAGEGIFYAHRTAELAAWAVHLNITQGLPLDKTYQKLLWKYVLPELFNVKMGRNIALNLADYGGYSFLRPIMNIFGKGIEDIMHGDRTTRLFLKRSVHEDVKLK